MKESRRYFVQLLLFCFFVSGVVAQEPIKWVNTLIGTSNYGTTNPGAQHPHGLMNITPFNVMGGEGINKFEKDSMWWSTPFSSNNSFLTGFAQVNLSGVGCPDLGSLLLMPTTGELVFDPVKYGSVMEEQVNQPGYYAVTLAKYSIRAEVTATERTSMARFHFPVGKANILLNLGEGLTNESGAIARFKDQQTITGSKLVGSFCYHHDAVFRLYFAMRIERTPVKHGFWKLQRFLPIDLAWDKYTGQYKPYEGFTQEMSGDNIGVFFSYDVEEPTTITVRTGVSMVSEEEAMKNLEAEQPAGLSFETIVSDAQKKWNKELSKIRVKGDSEKDKIVFYSALYHTLIHPNIAQDVSGSYNKMETLEKITLPQGKKRYTVFSLWDTFRTVHPLYCILDPKKQLEMIDVMLDMYKENGYLPKWELYSRETFTMDGDPAAIVINDTWQRGLRNFDTNLALEAIKRSALDVSKENKVRPNIELYVKHGYVPNQKKHDNCVSQSLEYYLSDFNAAQFALSMGDKETYKTLIARAKSYTKLFSKEYNCFRPRMQDGSFMTPFDPRIGKDFQENTGYHEGSAWNYNFYVPFDIKNLAKMMGGERVFTQKLDETFAKGYYDMANEPDIDNAYLYCYFPKYAYRTQEMIPALLDKYFTTAPGGLPGNDDTGTMSAWAIFSMLGFYPVSAGTPIYALTAPRFDEVVIELDQEYYPHASLTIEAKKESPQSKYIEAILLDGKPYRKGYIISHKELFSAEKLTFVLRDRRQ
ncbi:GH92 family glycosyl hydrolase [Porphyromonas canoris]|uniref:GH92 family glycosyl hydrolase n=1 Tax=Porphyromonas canoris TaxID=36875 RepID=UPI0009DF219B|nr:GH92 family glycosyl hydrolase [Porphyromonas canoris]